MNHWHTVGFLAAEHRADLAREAAGSSLLKLAEAAPDGRSRHRPLGSLGRARPAGFGRLIALAGRAARAWYAQGSVRREISPR